MFQTWWGICIHWLGIPNVNRKNLYDWKVSQKPWTSRKEITFLIENVEQLRFPNSPGGTLELSQVLPAVFLLREKLCWKYQLYISEILIIQIMLYPLIVKHKFYNNIFIKVVLIIRSYAHISYMFMLLVTLLPLLYMHIYIRLVYQNSFSGDSWNGALLLFWHTES